MFTKRTVRMLTPLHHEPEKISDLQSSYNQEVATVGLDLRFLASDQIVFP